MKHEKAKVIKSIVSSFYGLDLETSLRTYEYIKARTICYKIMRDEVNMTYPEIGRHFKKSHATVLCALRKWDSLLLYDKSMEPDYLEIQNIWYHEAHQYEEVEPFKLKKELKDLHNKNKMLNLSLIDVQEQCEELLKRTKKYQTVIDLIEERVPEKRMADLEKKLNHILNGM
tara:strand:- start:224 stop:739 length:516 start_codon:yes stop_codon:yes gene_type:complete